METKLIHFTNRMMEAIDKNDIDMQKEILEERKEYFNRMDKDEKTIKLFLFHVQKEKEYLSSKMKEIEDFLINQTKSKKAMQRYSKY